VVKRAEDGLYDRIGCIRFGEKSEVLIDEATKCFLYVQSIVRPELY